jgi:transposase
MCEVLPWAAACVRTVGMDLTEEQWKVVEPLIAKPKPRADGKGRPRQDDRAILNGILSILRTGAPWKDLPQRYPSRPTCHRRFQKWCRDGTLLRMWEALVEDLDRRGKINREETFIDGSFAMAKKGAPLLVRASGVRA